jgi:hypothetical protein
MMKLLQWVTVVTFLVAGHKGRNAECSRPLEVNAAGAANMATSSAESAIMITIRLLIYSALLFPACFQQLFLVLRGRILKLS